ncbi:autoinducer 2 sensor kinase [Vibrio sp. JCM 19236]|nr:autoinducer 2 sensor kinase [Vibrio sp. JCM 19236]
MLVSEHSDETSLDATNFSELAGLKVLLVEDNKTNAFVIQSMCLKKGLEVDWVTDGLLGIDRVAQQSYDLVLMDNQMPNMDGIDATLAIRKELKQTLPIIACTADGYDSTAAAFIDAGANQVLVKPIIESQLFGAIAQVMKA